MKKLLILVIAMASLTAFAQERRNNRSETIDLRNGRTTLRISVNNDRHDRNIGKRVKRLESAVRDLQDMVYDLQANPTTVDQTVYTCTLKASHFDEYIGEEQLTRTRAIKSVVDKCKSEEMFSSSCSTSKVTCTEDIAPVRY